MMRKMAALPPRPPPLDRPNLFRSASPAPPPNADSWRMSLTQYRKPARCGISICICMFLTDLIFLILYFRYSDQVPSYEKSMLEVSRRIRNRSVPPPAPSSSSSIRSLSRPPTPTPPSHFCHCGAGARASPYPENNRSYAANVSSFSRVYDYQRSTPSRGF